MIGTSIRGLNHLFRMVGNTPTYVLFRSCSSNDVICGLAIPLNDDTILLANPTVHSDTLDWYLSNVTESDKVRKSLENYTYSRTILPITKGCSDYYGSYVYDFIVLDDDFADKFDTFCRENKKAIEPLIYKYSHSIGLIKYLYCLTNGSKNLVPWAFRLYSKLDTSVETIRKLIIWYQLYGKQSSKLTKGTMTAYVNHKDIMHLLHETDKIRREVRKNGVVNTFNTEQRKLLRNKQFSYFEYDVIYKFSKLSDEKRLNFIKKMSTICDADEILRQMSSLVDVQYTWNKESLLNYLSNDVINCDLVANKGNAVLIKVNDFESIKRLAKTTNWCISKNKSYWNSYVEYRPESSQYMLFDFSKKEDDEYSIIGFTIYKNVGIAHAHNFINNPINLRSCVLCGYTTFDMHNINLNGILKKNGISISDLINTEDLRYEWNVDSFFEFIKENDMVNDVDLVMNKDNKVVLFTRGDTVSKMFTYMSESYPYRDCECVLFADFNKGPKDTDRVLVGDIDGNNESGKYVSYLVNIMGERVQESFDSKLEEFNLPYDTICRIDNFETRFKQALKTNDVEMLKRHIVNLPNHISKRKYSGDIQSYIISSIDNFKTLDGLKLFYDNGIKLHSVLKNRDFTQLLSYLIGSLANYWCSEYDFFSDNAEEAYECCKDAASRGECFFIGHCAALLMFIKNEQAFHDMDGCLKSCICDAVSRDMMVGPFVSFIKKILNFCANEKVSPATSMAL